MTTKDIEAILRQVHQRYRIFCDAESSYNKETDGITKAELKQDSDTKRGLLFDYVAKYTIAESPPFTEPGQFPAWEEYVKSLINRINGEETREKERREKEERSRQRENEKRKQGLRSELLTFLKQCKAYEESKLYCNKGKCDALNNCLEGIKEYFKDAFTDQNNFDTICKRLAEIVGNTLNNVEISLAPENYWTNLKVFLTEDNPIICILQEKGEQ